MESTSGSTDSIATAPPERALSLDSASLDARRMLAMIKLVFDREPAVAEAQMKQVLETDPRSSLRWSWFAFVLMVQGRFEEAQAAADEGLRRPRARQAAHRHAVTTPS